MTQPDHMTDTSPGSLISALDHTLKLVSAVLLINVVLQTSEVTSKVLEHSYVREMSGRIWGGNHFLGDLYSPLCDLKIIFRLPSVAAKCTFYRKV